MFSERTTLQRLLLLKALSGGGQTLVERTALGNPLTFITDVSKPLKSLLIPFTPIQSGTGDPSPQNIRSILPWNGLKVWNGGKNLYQFDEGNITTAKQADQQTMAVYLLDVPAGTYTLSAEYRTSGDYPDTAINIGRIENDVLSLIQSISVTYDRTVQISTGQTLCFMSNSSTSKFSENLQKYNLMLVVGSTAESYVPPTITETDIPFLSSVYGGTLDVVSGVLTVDRGVVRADAFSWETSVLTTKGQSFMTTGSVSVPFAPWQNENGQAFAMSNAMVKNAFAGTFDDAPANSFWWNNVRSGYRCVFDQNASVQDLINFFTENNVIFCGKLAEPYTVQLTPTQLTALLGNNTIWSDADGQMTAVYLKKG